MGSKLEEVAKPVQFSANDEEIHSPGMPTPADLPKVLYKSSQKL